MPRSVRGRRLGLRSALLAGVLAGAPVAGVLSPVGAASVGRAASELEALCGSHMVIRTPDGRALCTHGPDPAPGGVDFRVPQPLARPGQAHGLLLPDPPGDRPTQAAATPGIGCYGNGTDGNRVHAIYAFPADRPDRYGQVLGSIRHWAAEVDSVFQASASKTGGIRRVRFVTDRNCDLVVDRVPLSTMGDDTFENTIAELATRGYDRSDRKYLVWMDSTVLCGIGTYYLDDRPTADNFNNGRAGVPGSVGRIDAGCWGLGSRGQSVEAHELMHNLGAVQLSAPNSTVNGHCSDDDDRMCYADGSPLLVLRAVCGSNEEALFDCRGDDYFNSDPRAGTYLATHWNAANSSFLTASVASPTVSIGDAAVVEGHSGTVPLVFPLSLSAPNAQPVTVRFATTDASARADEDYVATSGTLTFNPGETSKSVAVLVKGDAVREASESLALVLTAPANAILGRTQAFGTITDDEPTSQGYRFVAADGGIFSFGDARFFGSTGDVRLNQPIVGMAGTPSGNGYWLVASDGGIFAFGDARFFGSTGGMRLDHPIVAMAATPSGNGYWFVAADGGVFPFGDAAFHGAPGGVPPAVVSIAVTRSGAGYWMAGSDGSVYAFGDARSFGSVGNLNQPVVGMAVTPSGGGYWLVARDGGIFAFGDARFLGSTGNVRLNQPIVGMTAPGRL